VALPVSSTCLSRRGCVGRVGRGTELRFDVLNVGDTVYQIRNGTGLAPQFGLRRTALAGLTQRF
jgi:hypothetical protein